MVSADDQVYECRDADARGGGRSCCRGVGGSCPDYRQIRNRNQIYTRAVKLLRDLLLFVQKWRKNSRKEGECLI